MVKGDKRAIQFWIPGWSLTTKRTSVYGEEGWSWCWFNTVFTKPYKKSCQNLKQWRMMSWKEIVLKPTSKIKLSCSQGHVLHDEWNSSHGVVVTGGLRSRWQSAYAARHAIYGLHMMERSSLLEHLNIFNKINSELLTINMKFWWGRKDSNTSQLFFQIQMIIQFTMILSNRKLYSLTYYWKDKGQFEAWTQH